MGKQYSLEFANLICKFGEKNLTDYLEEIVLPAFFDPDLKRKYGASSYFFIDQKIFEIETEKGKDTVIAGRFIKDTVLISEQLYDAEEGIIKEERTMKSAPNAIFCLILNNHRLIYLNETRFAPPLNTFKSTLKKFFNKKRILFIENEYKKIKKIQETKASLMKKIPIPRLEIEPLSSKASLDEFIKSFELLKTVEIIIRDTNQEIDMSQLVNRVRNAKDRINSKASKLTHHNPKGLDKQEATKQLVRTAQQGNSQISMRGVDEFGMIKTGNNEDFKLKISVSDIPLGIKAIARWMYDEFSNLVNRKEIPLPERKENIDIPINFKKK